MKIEDRKVECSPFSSSPSWFMSHEICLASLFFFLLVFTAKTRGCLACCQIRESNLEDPQEISDLTVLLSLPSFRWGNYLTQNSSKVWAGFRPWRAHLRGGMSMLLTGFQAYFYYSRSTEVSTAVNWLHSILPHLK